MAQPHEKTTDESIKDTIESIVIALVLAFLFRAYVVEAFVIPTGSMAPTLLGAHVTTRCQQCGYQFPVGISEGQQLPRGTRLVCPMCRFPNPRDALEGPRTGDRIMVQKYVYDFTEPKRWDVVVFKAPHVPQKNYIKRLVAKPGETLAILDGNLYIKGPGPDSDWHIARKANRPEVQRAVWQPIYHSQYIPRDDGEDRPQPRGRLAGRLGSLNWQPPWVAPEGEKDRWRIKGRRNYRYQGKASGWVRFRFERGGYESEYSRYPYNQLDPLTPNRHNNDTRQPQPAEDVRLAATIELDQSAFDQPLKLQTTARLDQPQAPGHVEKLTAVLSDDGAIALTATNPATGTTRTLAEGSAPWDRLPTDRPFDVTLWYVDQTAILWIEGQQALRYDYNLSLEALKNRPPPQTAQPAIHMPGRGTIHRVELDRDLYYSSVNTNDSPDDVARGGLVRKPNGKMSDAGKPFQLHADEFFCMGDNSPSSNDSRFWGDPTPAVRDKAFTGEPQAGVVPRELLVGRAFFVYWPAHYKFAWSDRAIPPLPNFGDMRFIE